MSTPANKARTLSERTAAAKKQAAVQQMKARVASAWTLAKTMLPNAPAPIQLKFAKSLLANSTRILKSALKQTAINAHYTHIAESFETEHKVSLNEYLDDPSVLTKEENGLKAELKADPKAAAAKKADDLATAKSFVQPDTYEEGKRTEPAGMDADDVEGSKPLNVPVNEKKEAAKAHVKGCLCEPCKKKAKEAAAKIAHGADCKGCENCDKTATAKKAEGEGIPAEEPGAADAPAETTADGDAPDTPAVDGGVEGDVPPVDDAVPAEDAAPEPDPVEFDAEKEQLLDSVADLKDDIDKIEDAIDAVVEGEDDAVAVGDDALAEDADLEAVLGDEENVDADLDATELDGEGEELDLASIFSNDNFEDKVAALNGETIEADGDLDDIFGPSDAADLELALDQEESLTSPADMFDLETSDPMAALFGKQGALDEESIVEPGELEDFFGEQMDDDRDWDTDHEGDILSAALDSVSQDDFNDPNRKQPTKLQTPKEATKGKAAAKPAPKHIRALRPQGNLPKMSGKDIAALLFSEED
jgi:hypothetical protein